MTFGSSPIANEALFAARPGTIESNDEYIFSWSPAYVEANTVGSVAVVVTTKRLVESQSLLQKVQIATALAGLLALFGGIGFVVRTVTLFNIPFEFRVGMQRQGSQATAGIPSS